MQHWGILIIVGTLVSLFTLLTIGLCGIRRHLRRTYIRDTNMRSSRSRSMIERSTSASALAPPSRTHDGDVHSSSGLSQLQISLAAPLHTVSMTSCSSHDVCSICLDEIVGSKHVRIVARCGHAFHSVCIGDWLRRVNKCPNCLQAAMPVELAATTADDTTVQEGEEEVGTGEDEVCSKTSTQLSGYVDPTDGPVLNYLVDSMV